MEAIQMAPLRLAVMFIQAGDELAAKAREDRGEIGSWLLLAAGLALLAVAVGGQIAGWINGIVTTLTGTAPAPAG